MALLKGNAAKGLMKGVNAKGVLQGLAGNLSEVSAEQLTNEYGQYLLEGEEINVGYKLVRDAMVVTDIRVIDFNRQGATGSKMRANTIFLNTIVGVTCETAGFGLDDSEITITYIDSPNYTGNRVTTKDAKTNQGIKGVQIKSILQSLEFYSQSDSGKKGRIAYHSFFDDVYHSHLLDSNLLY